MWKSLFTPNETVTRHTAWGIIAGWVVLWLAFWTFTKPIIFPNPLEVLDALPGLVSRYGLFDAVLSSLTVSVESLLLSITISLPLAYVSRAAGLRPLALGLSKLRFLSPAVFFIILLFTVSGGHMVKVWMLALGESFFLVTTMVTVVQNIPQYKYHDARTLRMSPWVSTWYVTIRGTLADAFDAIRDNAAMGWSMLMMVEGFVRSEGGVGVLLLNQEKHVNFAEVYATALVIVVVGILQDYFIGAVKDVCCPWTQK